MDRSTTGTRLDRYLSQTDVWALSLGCIIVWGAFVMPGTTFLPVTGPLGTVVAMALSTLIMLLIGYNYFFLMKHYPGTGGVYAYCKATLGRDHAFLSAWFLCLSYLSLIPQNATMMAAMCRAIWGNALRGGISYTVAGAEVYLGEVAVAIAVLILFGALAILQKPFLQHIQTALALVLFFGAAAIAILVTPHIPFDQLFTHPSAGGGHSLSAIMTIIILAPWAFVGFEVISLETAHFRFSMEKSGKLIFLRYSREALSTALWPCRRWWPSPRPMRTGRPMWPTWTT